LLPVTASRVSIPDFFNPNIFLPNQCFFFLVHQKGAVEKERSSWNARPYQAKERKIYFFTFRVCLWPPSPGHRAHNLLLQKETSGAYLHSASWFIDGTFSLFTHIVEGVRGLSLTLFVRVLISFMKFPFW
jgi:hypothetical protein